MIISSFKERSDGSFCQHSISSIHDLFSARRFALFALGPPATAEQNQNHMSASGGNANVFLFLHGLKQTNY